MGEGKEAEGRRGRASDQATRSRLRTECFRYNPAEDCASVDRKTPCVIWDDGLLSADKCICAAHRLRTTPSQRALPCWQTQYHEKLDKRLTANGTEKHTIDSSQTPLRATLHTAILAASFAHCAPSTKNLAKYSPSFCDSSSRTRVAMYPSGRNTMIAP